MIRARFVVVPLLVAAVPGGLVAAVAVDDALAEREARANVRRAERQVAPARAALDALRVEGLDPCPSRDDFVCRRGRGESQATSTAVERALRAVGATDVRSECRKTVSGQVGLCRVQGRLHGADVHATVRPYGDRAAGVVEVGLTATVWV